MQEARKASTSSTCTRGPADCKQLPLPGSFAALMKPVTEERASMAPMPKNCFLGTANISFVTMPFCLRKWSSVKYTATYLQLSQISVSKTAWCTSAATTFAVPQQVVQLTQMSAFGPSQTRSCPLVQAPSLQHGSSVSCLILRKRLPVLSTACCTAYCKEFC